MRASTVDNFQGEEARVVIVSLVRSNAAGAIGFLKAPQRVNVLLSRARDSLILLGNPLCLLGHRGTLVAHAPVATPATADAPPWRAGAGAAMPVQELKYAEPVHAGAGASGGAAAAAALRLGNKAHSVWQTVFKRIAPVNGALSGFKGFPMQCEHHPGTTFLGTAQDFAVQAPRGGCSKPCGQELACGHICSSTCHSSMMPHPTCMVEVPCRCDLVLPRTGGGALNGCEVTRHFMVPAALVLSDTHAIYHTCQARQGPGTPNSDTMI